MNDFLNGDPGDMLSGGLSDYSTSNGDEPSHAGEDAFSDFASNSTHGNEEVQAGSFATPSLGQPDNLALRPGEVEASATTAQRTSPETDASSTVFQATHQRTTGAPNLSHMLENGSSNGYAMADDSQQERDSTRGHSVQNGNARGATAMAATQSQPTSFALNPVATNLDHVDHSRSAGTQNGTNDQALKKKEVGIQPQPHTSDSSTQIQPTGSSEVIDLIDDDGASEGPSTQASSKRQKLSSGEPRVTTADAAAANASLHSRYDHLPDWMKRLARFRDERHANQQSSSQAPKGVASSLTLQSQTARQAAGRPEANQRYRTIYTIGDAQYFDFPSGFEATRKDLLPKPEAIPQNLSGSELKVFELSLLNVSDFTITGMPTSFEGAPSSVAGLRAPIKKISRPYGKAVFERGNNGENGRWRIPLQCYHELFAFLNRLPNVKVGGIPEYKLKVASLGRLQLEKGFPTKRQLVEAGVPKTLARALAPFQRGGVDFIKAKDGRALLADDMGLGKTVQSIAAMSVYHDEWPLLVLTPSSARYHWESEFQQWLGVDSRLNRLELDAESRAGDDDDDLKGVDASRCMQPLEDSQIHVLASSKEDLFPNPNVRVVICSYGLAPTLASIGKLYPSLFRCAIVDESHMLKNASTKRTSSLMPVLYATSRCILLSGTPALARPSELWPQLKILSSEKQRLWENEQDFIEKYVKRNSARRRAELHTLLCGTLMLRRLKTDILKTLPKKARSKLVADVLSHDMRLQFHEMLLQLREGKGVLGKLARQHMPAGNPAVLSSQHQALDGTSTAGGIQNSLQNESEIQQEIHARYTEGMRQIRNTVENTPSGLDSQQRSLLIAQLEGELRQKLEVQAMELSKRMKEQQEHNSAESKRSALLNQMYLLTAKAKIPMLVEMVKKWLADPTKGKLCVFAHHLSVLDAIVELSGLSNEPSSQSRFIRIDGSTSPKERQRQIRDFQTDPSVKIAVLGITAAGVAVTLTASSTVWFAEMFWTPALMIQAEDRCHRIGQNARVHCVYFIAVGTLDELLWKLLEKKFRELGEFVEGKEKQKLVVETTYDGLNAFAAQFEDGSGFSDELALNEEDEAIENEDQQLLQTLDLEDDMEELARQELSQLKQEQDEDDPQEAAGTSEDLSPPKKLEVAGKSEDNAIMLSDDEEEQTLNGKGKPRNIPDLVGADGRLNNEAPIKDARAYHLRFGGPSYGMQLRVFYGRVVVEDVLDKQASYPKKGDVLVLVGGRPIPPINVIGQILPYLKVCIKTPPVQLTFVESVEIATYYKRCLYLEEMKKKKNSAPAGAGEVIELLDD